MMPLNIEHCYKIDVKAYISSTLFSQQSQLYQFDLCITTIMKASLPRFVPQLSQFEYFKPGPAFEIQLPDIESEL